MQESAAILTCHLFYDAVLPRLLQVHFKAHLACGEQVLHARFEQVAHLNTFVRRVGELMLRNLHYNAALARIHTTEDSA